MQPFDFSLLVDHTEAARKLLGAIIEYNGASGRVVETEAYHQEDPASHSFHGNTKRTAPMFGPAGGVYIYFTYGMHYCLNVVTGPAGYGSAVLIRALEPLTGLDTMRANRGVSDDHQLTNGPAKLVQALGIQPSLSGTMFNQGRLRLLRGEPTGEIVTTTRIGITKAVRVEARYYIRSNPYVSRK